MKVQPFCGHEWRLNAEAAEKRNGVLHTSCELLNKGVIPSRKSAKKPPRKNGRICLGVSLPLRCG